MKPLLKYIDPLESLPIDEQFWSTERVENLQKCLIPTEFLGKKCLAFKVEPGDHMQKGGEEQTTERTELFEKYEQRLEFFKHVKYSFEIALPNEFVICDNRLNFVQWKHDKSQTQPFLSFRYQNGKFDITVKNSTDGILTFAQTTELRGNWHKFEVELYLTMDMNSEIKVKIDGEIKLDYKGKASFDGELPRCRFALGPYRDAVKHIDTLFYANFERLVLDSLN
ncbi:MAG: hypothetical protein Fur003_5470 [Candidatus Dojkabacteria bacterium]